MPWEPRDYIALAAIVMSPLGAAGVAWATAHLTRKNLLEQVQATMRGQLRSKNRDELISLLVDLDRLMRQAHDAVMDDHNFRPDPDEDVEKRKQQGVLFALQMKKSLDALKDATAPISLRLGRTHVVCRLANEYWTTYLQVATNVYNFKGNDEGSKKSVSEMHKLDDVQRRFEDAIRPLFDAERWADGTPSLETTAIATNNATR